MNSNNINVFIVHTEFHLLTAVNIALSMFSNSKNYIYISEERISGDYESSGSITFEKLPAIYGNALFVLKIESLKPQRFFFFQENSYDDVYLSYYLSKSGVTIALCEDGLKPYVVWHKKRLFLSVLKNAYTFYKNFLSHKSFVPILYINRYTYAFTPKVQELFLRFPHNYNNRTHKVIVEIPDFSKSVDFLKKMFKCDDICTNNVLLYVGQPLKYEFLWKREIEIISQIKSIYKDKKFIYKPHPLCKQVEIDMIKKLGEVTVYEERVPVELLIISLSNSVVVSPYSTGLLVGNPSCKFYWFHDMLNNRILGEQLKIINPTNHIKEIIKIEEVLV